MALIIMSFVYINPFVFLVDQEVDNSKPLLTINLTKLNNYICLILSTSTPL